MNVCEKLSSSCPDPNLFMVGESCLLISLCRCRYFIFQSSCCNHPSHITFFHNFIQINLDHFQYSVVLSCQVLSLFLLFRKKNKTGTRQFQASVHRRSHQRFSPGGIVVTRELIKIKKSFYRIIYLVHRAFLVLRIQSTIPVGCCLATEDIGVMTHGAFKTGRLEPKLVNPAAFTHFIFIIFGPPSARNCYSSVIKYTESRFKSDDLVQIVIIILNLGGLMFRVKLEDIYEHHQVYLKTTVD